MLTIADISKSYGTRELFSEVSLFVARTDRFGLVGANGAGKTTLFNLILGEDTIAAGQMLLAGWRIAYCAEAQVRHSHHYGLRNEMARYFDIGVLHQREAWMLEQFGRAEGEGLRFIRSEWAHLARHAPWLIPEATLRTLLKYLGYRLGHSEKRLSLAWKRRLSMQPSFWRDETNDSA